MAMTTIEGWYTDGKIELSEHPENIGVAQVLVTFITIESPLPFEVRERQRKEAIARVVARMRSGIGSITGGPYYIDREELYAERTAQLERRSD